MGKMELSILESERFKKAYNSALALRGLAESAVQEMGRRAQANPATWWRDYPRIKGLADFVLEVDLAGGPRLLAYPEGTSITLLDMGNHEVVGRYSNSKFNRDLQNRSEGRPQFHPEGGKTFFQRDPYRAFDIFAPEELTSQWVHFLDLDQSSVADAIEEDAVYEETTSGIHLVVGGPGTGKTCILLNLAARFVQDWGLQVGLHISDGLAQYTASSALIDWSQMQELRARAEADRLQILLEDDPATASMIGTRVNQAHELGARLVVFAFDPLQLDKDLSDREYRQMLKHLDAQEHVLTTSYRQKAKVGRQTKHAVDRIADSTPFLDSRKIENYKRQRQRLTTISNRFTFRNRGGYVERHIGITREAVGSEISRIRTGPTLWRHWPALLIVLDDDFTGLDSSIERILKRVNHQRITLSEINQIKGMEYQHVFLFLSSELHGEIEYGFRGTGRNVYDQRRLLRIPFSRAKDSVVTFVEED